MLGQSDWVGDLADAGLLAPIDLAAQRSGFRPVAVAAFTHAQQTYGVPVSTDSVVLFRNTGLVPAPPESIEAMAEAGLALEDDGKVDVPIALPIGPTGDAVHWYPLYSAAGGFLFGQNLDGSYRTDPMGVGQPGSIRAAQDLAELAEQGAIDPDLALGDAVDAFAEGRTAFLVADQSAVAAAQAAGIPFTVEEIPGFASTTRPLSQSLVSSQGFMLSAFSRNALLAQEFLTRTVMTTDTMGALQRASGHIPAWRDTYAATATDPLVRGFGEVADASVPIPNLAVMPDAWRILGQAQRDVLEGAPAARTMRTAGTEIQAAIDAS
jgi:arabinogalactan oligomer/maltooligosaccharide transport system substrate-binding protein